MSFDLDGDIEIEWDGDPRHPAPARTAPVSLLRTDSPVTRVSLRLNPRSPGPGQHIVAWADVEVAGLIIVCNFALKSCPTGSYRLVFPNRKRFDRCPECGSKHPYDAKFCPECGTRLPEFDPEATDRSGTPGRRIPIAWPREGASSAILDCLLKAYLACIASRRVEADFAFAPSARRESA